MPPPSNPPQAPGLSNQLTNPAKKATQADNTSQPRELGQDDSCSDSAGEHHGPRPFGGHRPGEGPVPSVVDTVVLLSDGSCLSSQFSYMRDVRLKTMARTISWPFGTLNK